MDEWAIGRYAVVKPNKNNVCVYVEGGSTHLESDVRQAFAKFFAKTELGEEKRPRIVVCGSRGNAYKRFNTAIINQDSALLLVDSEAPISSLNEPQNNNNPYKPWEHLKTKDNWDKPKGAKDDDCHLMVQIMESWFIADWEAVSKYFGQGFKANAKPAQLIEKIHKSDVKAVISKATRDCKTKEKYDDDTKGEHSFKLLALISPDKVMKASPWAKRFIDEIIKRKSMT
jgi:hypothetical protein